MTINVISTFLFASLLLPQLRATARKHSTTPNIAIVGSAVHFWCDTAQLTGPVEGNILKSLSEEKTAVIEGQILPEQASSHATGTLSSQIA